MATHETPPWKQPKPKSKSKAKTKLTPESVAWAKAKAKKAGRRYPNLVDNMAATRRQTARSNKANGERSRP